VNKKMLKTFSFVLILISEAISLKQAEKCTLNCQNGGFCSLTWVSMPRQNDAMALVPRCTCAEGFTGDLCQVESSKTYVSAEAQEICPKQCFNQGECVWKTLTTKSVIEGYNKQMICECQDGFTGEHCEITLQSDSCEMECHNGGKCVYRWESSPKHTKATVRSMGCECPHGFIGPSCEIVSDQNAESESICSLQCENGGDCVFAWMNNHNNNYFSYVFLSSMMVCKCQPGFMGLQCEYTAEFCEDGTMCLNGGICVPDQSKESSFACDCSGLSGANDSHCSSRAQPSTICDHDVVGMDKSLFCLNGGKCYAIKVEGSSTYHHECKCSGGYGGPHCEFVLAKNM